jgi:hypothetical protein
VSAGFLLAAALFSFFTDQHSPNISSFAMTYRRNIQAIRGFPLQSPALHMRSH